MSRRVSDPVWGVFLRGINLGKRQMKMAELRTCLENAGFTDVKTVLASGNVRLSSPGAEAKVKTRLEKAICDAFDYKVQVVLRSWEELESMIKGHPFDALDPTADLTRHVLMFDKPLPKGIEIDSRRQDTEILRIDTRDIYIAAYRQPNGRYTENVGDVLKPLYQKLGKGGLDTMRNWNTIEKMLK